MVPGTSVIGTTLSWWNIYLSLHETQAAGVFQWRLQQYNDIYREQFSETIEFWLVESSPREILDASRPQEELASRGTCGAPFDRLDRSLMHIQVSVYLEGVEEPIIIRENSLFTN